MDIDDIIARLLEGESHSCSYAVARGRGVSESCCCEHGDSGAGSPSLA